jgi:hypothetical protein
MDNKQLGIVLLVIGVIVLLLSLLANSIGGATGFGYKQITGTVVGVILAIVGSVLFSRK